MAGCLADIPARIGPRRKPAARQAAQRLAGALTGRLVLLLAGLCLLAAAFAVPPAQAQTNPLEGRAGARCFQIRNHAPYTVYGHAATADDHRANFHLKTGEGVEVCVTGPYYPGGKIEVTTKTLIPTFSCLTVPEGVVTIEGEFVSGGGTKTRVNCH
jgi:hypothetical protein